MTEIRDDRSTDSVPGRAGLTPLKGSKGGAAVESPPAAPPPSGPPGYVPTPPPPEDRGRRRSPGATAGIILIVLGMVFLAGQFLPGFAWWSLWPLVIVIAGVVQIVTPGKEGWGVGRVFDGLVTVTFGFVALAVTTGIVGFGVVWQIMALWPVLLIAIGFDILGKALHISWLRALGSLAVIAALVYAVAISMTSIEGFRFGGTASGSSATLDEPRGTVDEASLTLDAGVANVSLSSGNALITAEGTSPWGRPDFEVERSGDSAEVKLSLADSDGAFMWPGSRSARLDAELSDEVLWDITLNTGVSSLDANFAEVPVRSLELKPGVAECVVKLGEVPSELSESTAVVKAGVSSVSLSLPAGVEARIESDSGLTGHDIGGDFERVDSGVWETPGYEQARESGEGVWLITVKSGVGSFQADTY